MFFFHESIPKPILRQEIFAIFPKATMYSKEFKNCVNNYFVEYYVDNFATALNSGTTQKDNKIE